MFPKFSNAKYARTGVSAPLCSLKPHLSLYEIACRLWAGHSSCPVSVARSAAHSLAGGDVVLPQYVKLNKGPTNLNRQRFCGTGQCSHLYQ